MTTREMKPLHAVWIEKYDILRNLDQWSRSICEPALEGIRQWDVMSQPDFGWVMAYQMGANASTSTLLGKPPYRWVSRAAKFVETQFKRDSTDPGVMIVSEADALNMKRDSPLRVLLNATLLARDATVEAVAGALGLNPQLVEAYADLFFNVLDRKDEPSYRQKAVQAALSRPGMVYDFKTADPLEFALLHTGRGGTIADVMRLADRCGREVGKAAA